jgi:hypothetical protein
MLVALGVFMLILLTLGGIAALGNWYFERSEK